jgi:hypothetical protein
VKDVALALGDLWERVARSAVGGVVRRVDPPYQRNKRPRGVAFGVSRRYGRRQTPPFFRPRESMAAAPERFRRADGNGERSLMSASAIAAGLDRRDARAPPRASVSWAIAIVGCAAARVLAVGPGARDEDGKYIEMDVAEGDEIVFSKYGGTEIKLGTDEVLILRETDVLAKVVNTGGKRKRKLAGATA